MDTTFFSAMVGVLGSFVGASTAIATGWITQKTQETLKKRELIWAEIDKRELLYGKYIGECSKLIVDAYGHTLFIHRGMTPSRRSAKRVATS